MDQNTKIALVLLILVLLGRNCSTSVAPTGTRVGPQGTTSGQADPEQPPVGDPDTISGNALAEYETAKSFESRFYATRNSNYANIAIKSFLAYYQNAPNGNMACVALLKTGELYHHLGNNSEARNILATIRRRPDFVRDYSAQIAKLVGLIGER